MGDGKVRKLFKLATNLLVTLCGLAPLVLSAEELPERVPHEYLVKIVPSRTTARAGTLVSSQRQDILKSFTDLGMKVEPALKNLNHLPLDSKPSTQTLKTDSTEAEYFRVQLGDHLDLDMQGESQLLLGHPGVVEVTPNYIFRTLQVIPDPFLTSQGAWGQAYQDLWNVHRINAPSAWNISEGEGVKVAVIDSGVDYNHPDIRSAIWSNAAEVAGNGIDDDRNGFVDDVRGYDFTTCDKYGTFGCSQKKERDADPMDLHGHGTHCSGTIAATRNNGTGIAGVSPKAKIIPIRALNQSGGGELIDLADAVLYAINIGADVINASWGASGVQNIPIFEEVFELARQRGVLVVAAAGNDNKLVYDITPGGSQKVLTVGSSDVNDAKSPFSNFSEGPYYNSGYKKTVEIAAPGGGGVIAGAPRGSFDHINILSLRANGTDMYVGSQGYPVGGAIVSDPGTNNQLYYRSAGTSMAAPMVSGAAAVVLAHLRSIRQQGNLSAEEYRRTLMREVQARLIGSAKKIPEISKADNWIGYGRLDVSAALSENPAARILILDDQVEESAGNSNGIVESGEDGSITLTLSKEFGDFATLEGELVAKDSNVVTVTNARAQFRFDGSGSARSVQSTPFVFQARNVYFQTPVEFSLRLIGTTQPIEIPMTLYVGARRLSTTALYSKESFFGGFSPISIPSIANHRVAWADTRYGNSDIMLFDFRTLKTTLVTPASDNQPGAGHPAIQYNPYLSDHHLAWQDDREGNWDIRLAAIDKLGENRPLALGEIGGQNQHQPVLRGRNLFFTNEAVPGKINPDLKVMHYDIDAQKVTTLSTQGSQFNPALSDSSAVWENTSALGLEIVPDTSVIKQRTALSLPLFPFRWPIEPAIDGNKIVFIDGTFGAGRDLFVVEYNAVQSKNVLRQLTSDAAQQWRPQIHRNQVVWADDRSGVWGIRSFDLEKEREFTLSTGGRASGVPNTRDGYVTWIQRGSLWVTQLPGFAAAPQPTPTATPAPQNPTPSAQPTPSEAPGAQVKIAVKKGSSRVTKNKVKTRKINLVPDVNQRFSGVSLYLVPQSNKICDKPLITFASLEGVRNVSIRIPDALRLRKITLEVRSSSGVVLGRARLATNSTPMSGVSIIPAKKRVSALCNGIKASS